MNRPLVQEVSPVPDVLGALQAFSDWPTPLLLDSARNLPGLGRYSFLTADPLHFECRQRVPYGGDPFAALRRFWETHRTERIGGLPPFQGGVAGLLGYELGGVWERIPRAAHDEFEFPDLAAGVYDWVLAWDLERHKCWLICHGLGGDTADTPSASSQASPRAAAGSPADADRRRIARWRRDRVLAQLETAVSPESVDLSHSALDGGTGPLPPLDAQQAVALRPEQLQAHAAPGRLHGLRSSFTRDEYLRTVRRVIDYIYAGDIFQANLSQRLVFPQRWTPLQLYERLRTRNAAPFAGFFQHDDWSILSASPERFVRVNDGEVAARPIKGTRRRGAVPEADLYTRDELRESIKDRAENVMIVDLLRNDLSRVCRPGSVRVVDLCRVESYETVQHLVSEIRGTLAADSSGWDLLAATFPGGSITGAPKVRAMEIIAELERTVRGPYCGSLFYLGFDGQMDSNILIRTLAVRRGWIQCAVGGGVVAQSVPDAEYAETLDKAEGMLRALRD